MVVVAGVGFVALRRLSRWLFAVTTLLFLVLSLPVVGSALLLPLETAAPTLDESADFDGVKILVPMSGIFDDADGQSWATIKSTRRVVAGQLLQKRLNLPLTVAGGGPFPDQPPEAEARCGSTWALPGI